MHSKRLFSAFVAGAALVALTAMPSSATHTKGHGRPGQGDDDIFTAGDTTQHGGIGGHLPSGSANVDLVGKLKLTNFVDDISDVSATEAPNGKWYAYLGDWGAKCQTGGVHVVDISDPANPTKIGFLNAGGTGYQTEGVQALHIDTTDYTGDILVVSNEWCLPKANPKDNPGGFTIWNIDDPTNPVKLVDAFGDFDLYGNRANEAHSAIAWDAGDGDAYLAAIDNEEIKDVDLFEITDPTSPAKLAETELPGVNVDAYGSEKTSHDFDVLQFPDSTWHLMVSDWDAGWIDVNVTDPANPVIVGDFDYATCDQVVPSACPPEGNAHQGEWNSDGSLFVGTDEDSSPFRLPIEVTSGPLTGSIYAGGEFSFTKQVASFPGGKINGPTVFGGYGCPDDTAEIPDPSVLTTDPGEEKIIVFQRGPSSASADPNHPHSACFFSDKIFSGETKGSGYDVVIIANHHAGSQLGALPDSFICGSQGSPVQGTAAGLCVGHRFMHEAFGETPNYTIPYPLDDPSPADADPEPDPGTLGPEIEAQSEYDGFGYARVVDTSNPAAPTEVDQFAITEGHTQSFSSGYGDLTIHEVEVPRGDPNEGGSMPDDDLVAYYSWYSGGFRVMDLTDLSSGDPQANQLGWYIPPGGHDLWGVALAQDENGDRIVLLSDRDYGLFIYRYTGPLPTSP